ncbi:MAG TPA: hypothetical protein VGR14_14985 [Verrucomicrobiae bacterium]|jgi:hypothetical protein|nr:hypothetical protein [Verrucomicrobiae bacterium]
MKTKVRSIFSALLIATFHTQLPTTTAFAQGSLAPPGPPGPTMKSLDQIEARGAITNSGAVTISQSGSYYLTRNITVASGDAITIAADNVTLDLNGFTISTTTTTPNGFAIDLVGTRHSITILNGFIQGSAGTFEGSTVDNEFNSGIDYSNAAPDGVRVSGLTVNTVAQHGIYLGENTSIIQSCLVDNAGDTGIYASLVSDSIAYNCGTSAAIVGRTVNNCNGASTSSGYGIYAVSVNNSAGTSSSGVGIGATYANYSVGTSGSGDGLDTATAYNCTGGTSSTGSGNGLNAAVIACNCTGNCAGSGVGLYAPTALSCVGYSPVGNGVQANNAQNCNGNTYSAYGVQSSVAENCYGYSSGNGSGVVVDATAINCYGYTVGNGSGVSVGVVGPNDGIFGVAQNCVGLSAGGGTGLNTISANNCNGASSTGIGLSCASAVGSEGQSSGAGGTGLSASGIVIGCNGVTFNGGLGLSASIANSCFGSSYSFGMYQYNMP